jgi:UDP-glucose 4-epimerase
MKILITGSSGFIGSVVAGRLAKSHTIVHYNKAAGDDIGDLERLTKKGKGCDAIIHLSALCAGRQDSIENPVEYFSVNTLGTMNVMLSASKNGIKKVIFSSTPHTMHPTTPYDLSKLQAEQWIKLFNELHGTKAQTLRIYHVYGKDEKRGVVKVFLERMKENKQLDVYGDGSQYFDFVNVKDVAKSIEMFIEKDYPLKEFYEIGTGRKTTINRLIQIISEQTGVKPRIKYLPGGEGANFVAKNPLPFEKMRIEDGIRELVSG